MAWLTAKTTIVIFDSLSDGFNFTLLTVRAPKLQSSDLKSDQAITNFYDMNQSVQIV